MIDDVRDIQAYYDASVGGEHSRLDRHQLERDITRRYFADYLAPNSRLLEIGAATGGHTLWLARQGHRVTAVDLSGALIDRCREEAEASGLEDRIQCFTADARDLSSLPPAAYDAVLLMGPLYHLVEEADRAEALRQARSRLKAGGMVFSAFISRLGIWGDCIKAVPAWIEDQRDVRSILETGRDWEHSTEDGFRGYFALVDEIAPLHESVGFETVVLAGVEPAISADDESYNRLEGNHRELWLDLLYELSAEPSLVAGSRHLLYIGRKRDR